MGLSVILRPINKDLKPLKWWIIKNSSFFKNPGLDLELYWYLYDKIEKLTFKWYKNKILKKN